jgi:AP2-associated kinase
MTMSISLEPRRIQKPSLSASSNNVLSQSVHLSKNSTSISSDPSYSNMVGSDLPKSHSVPMEPPRQATRSPTKPRKSLVLEKSEQMHTQSVGNATPRPRRISRKAETFEPAVPQSVKVPTERFTPPPKNPHRKSSTLFGTDALPPTRSEDRSTSPERPYQGVGKLIDQWQKKTAEADSQTTFAGKRGGFVPKRAGIMHGDDERGQ